MINNRNDEYKQTQFFIETQDPKTPCKNGDPVGTMVTPDGTVFKAPNNEARPIYKDGLARFGLGENHDKHSDRDVFYGWLDRRKAMNLTTVIREIAERLKRIRQIGVARLVETPEI